MATATVITTTTSSSLRSTLGPVGPGVFSFDGDSGVDRACLAAHPA